MLDDVFAHVVTDGIGIPDGPAQQMLHTVRAGLPGPFCDRVEYVAHLIELGRSPNAVNAAMSAIRTWMPEDQKPGTKQARGMLNEYKKTWAKRTAVRKGAPDHGRTTAGHGRHLRSADHCRAPRPTHAPPRPGALNRRIELADLCLIVGQSLDSVLTELAAYSVPVEKGPVERTGANGPITSVYVRDPDHNLIELSTYVD